MVCGVASPHMRRMSRPHAAEPRSTADVWDRRPETRGAVVPWGAVGYFVLVPARSVATPNPASRALTITSARVLAPSFQKMLET